MKKYLIIICMLAFSSAAMAQENGYLTGSFETTDHVYVKDAENKFVPGDDNFGSNNYLKLDYYKGNLPRSLFPRNHI